MSERFEYRLLTDDAESARLGDILERCFFLDSGYYDMRLPSVGRDNVRVLLEKGEVAGGLWQIPTNQFYGGRPVPMVGIGAVGVDPAFRGRGAAHTLMSACVRELHQKEIALSSLYPATNTLYKKSGYELAGYWCRLDINAKALDAGERGLEVRSVSQDDHEQIAEVYVTMARHINGYLERCRPLWDKMYKPREKASEGLGVFNGKNMEAYCLYSAAPTDPEGYAMTVWDSAFITPRAGRRLLSMLAQHGSMVRKISMFGGPLHPLIPFISEKHYEMVLQDYWMLRITHVEAALTGRGYPPGVSLDLHLRITDDIISENQGTYVLSIKKGKASVKRGGRGEISLDVRGLAALYSGFLSAHHLALTGGLDAPETALALLDAAFAGSPPSFGDSF